MPFAETEFGNYPIMALAYNHALFTAFFKIIPRLPRSEKYSGKIRFYLRSGKSQGVWYRVRVFLNPFSKSVKNQGNQFYVKVPANNFISYIRIDKVIFVYSYFCLFLAKIVVFHGE